MPKRTATIAALAYGLLILTHAIKAERLYTFAWFRRLEKTLTEKVSNAFAATGQPLDLMRAQNRFWKAGTCTVTLRQVLKSVVIILHRILGGHGVDLLSGCLKSLKNILKSQIEHGITDNPT